MRIILFIFLIYGFCFSQEKTDSVSFVVNSKKFDLFAGSFNGFENKIDLNMRIKYWNQKTKTERDFEEMKYQGMTESEKFNDKIINSIVDGIFNGIIRKNK